MYEKRFIKRNEFVSQKCVLHSHSDKKNTCCEKANFVTILLFLAEMSTKKTLKNCCRYFPISNCYKNC